MILPRSPGGEPGRHPLPAGLIHDLRTPLSHIIGYSEMLMEQAREAGHDAYLPDLQKVNAAGQRLLELLDEHFLATRSPGVPAVPAPAPAPGAHPSSRP